MTLRVLYQNHGYNPFRAFRRSPRRMKPTAIVFIDLSGVRLLDARIHQSLPLPATHTSTTITVEQREACHHWRHSAPSAWCPTFCAVCLTRAVVSPVIQSQSGTPGGTPRLIAGLGVTQQKSMLNSMLVNEDFLTWLLSRQPIRCQVWKSLLTNMDFNMEIS